MQGFFTWVDGDNIYQVCMDKSWVDQVLKTLNIVKTYQMHQPPANQYPKEVLQMMLNKAMAEEKYEECAKLIKQIKEIENNGA